MRGAATSRPGPRSSIEDLLVPWWSRLVGPCLWICAILGASAAASSGYVLPRHAAIGPVVFPLDAMPAAILCVALVWGTLASLLWRISPLVVILLLVPVAMDSWAPLPPGPLRYAVELDTAVSCSLGYIGLAAGESVTSWISAPEWRGPGVSSCLDAAGDVGDAAGRGLRAVAEFVTGAAAGATLVAARSIAGAAAERPPSPLPPGMDDVIPQLLQPDARPSP